MSGSIEARPTSESTPQTTRRFPAVIHRRACARRSRHRQRRVEYKDRLGRRNRRRQFPTIPCGCVPSPGPVSVATMTRTTPDKAAHFSTRADSVSGCTPSWSPIRLSSPRRGSGPLRASTAVLVARSLNSALYFRGAAMLSILHQVGQPPVNLGRFTRVPALAAALAPVLSYVPVATR